MPRMDRTGPEGKGSRTGRGKGRCGNKSGGGDTSQQVPGSGKGRKDGGGRGRGQGMRSGNKQD